MKKIVVLVAVLTMLGAAQLKAADAASAGKIGYVDLNRAMNEVEEGKKAKAQLEADGKSKQQKLQIKQDELKSASAEFEKQKPILSPDALQKKQNELQQKYVELQKMGAEFEKDFAQKENTLTKPITDKLRNIIANVGAKEGYGAILPKEMMLYAPQGTDLTDKVIASYNAGK